MANDVDISEIDLLRSHPEVLRKLLLDRTTHKNIFWATDSYAHLGEGFGFDDEITVEHITVENGLKDTARAVKCCRGTDAASQGHGGGVHPLRGYATHRTIWWTVSGSGAPTCSTTRTTTVRGLPPK